MIHSLKVGVFWVALNTDYYISRHKLIENKKKSRLYALIWDYSFINFQQKVPPIRLFSPIFLLIFKEFSHLYFYSDPSSIRNSRVNSPHLLSSDFWTIEILGSQRIIYVLHFFFKYQAPIYIMIWRWWNRNQIFKPLKLQSIGKIEIAGNRGLQANCFFVCIYTFASHSANFYESQISISPI